MIKRVKYVETIVQTHYVDVECENEEQLNDFIHDNQKIRVRDGEFLMKKVNYPDVTIKKIKSDCIRKSLGCMYEDETELVTSN